jgi:hypothetical protein
MGDAPYQSNNTSAARAQSNPDARLVIYTTTSLNDLIAYSSEFSILVVLNVVVGPTIVKQAQYDSL